MLSVTAPVKLIRDRVTAVLWLAPALILRVAGVMESA
jgi:hypothetical protein